MAPLEAVLMALCLVFIQVVSLVAFFLRSKNEVDDNEEEFLVYITLALVIITVVHWHELYSGTRAILSNLGKRRLKPLKLLLLIFELAMIGLLLTATIIVVPAQSKPIDVVMTGTALILIARLDDGYFQCFPYKASPDHECCKSTHDSEGPIKKVMYWFCLGGTMISGYYMYSMYRDNSDI